MSHKFREFDLNLADTPSDTVEIIHVYNMSVARDPR